MKKLITNPVVIALLCAAILVALIRCIALTESKYNAHMVIIEDVGISHTVAYPNSTKTFYETYCRDSEGREVVITSHKLYAYAKDNIGTELEIWYMATYWKDELVYIDGVKAIINREAQHAIRLDSVLIREGAYVQEVYA